MGKEGQHGRGHREVGLQQGVMDLLNHLPQLLLDALQL